MHFFHEGFANHCGLCQFFLVSLLIACPTMQLTLLWVCVQLDDLVAKTTSSLQGPVSLSVSSSKMKMIIFPCLPPPPKKKVSLVEMIHWIKNKFAK